MTSTLLGIGCDVLVTMRAYTILLYVDKFDTLVCL